MLSSSFGHLVRDTLILVTSLRSFSLSHIVRQVVAHTLTQRAKLFPPLLVWMESVLYNIGHFCFYGFFTFLKIFSGLVLFFFLIKKKNFLPS